MSYPMRKCRMRQLLNSVTTSDETDRIPTISVVKNVLKELKQIDEESNAGEAVKHVDETFMDARIYHAATDVAYKCVQNIDYTQQKFNIDDFADKLKSFLTNKKPEEYNIQHLYTIDLHVNLENAIPTLGSYFSLCGAKVIQAQRQTTQVKEKVDRNVKAPKPTKKTLIKVTDTEKETEIKSDDILKYYMKALTDEFKSLKKSVDYYEFVIDTTDFGLTVENIFYTSFHINDGKIQLLMSDDNEAKIQPMDKKTRVEFSQGKVEKKYQFVTSIDMSLWKEKCGYIQEGIVQKHRKFGTFGKH